MSEETVNFNLEINAEGGIDALRKVESIAYRALALIRRMGLPDNINQGIAYIQRFIGVVRLLHSSLNLLLAASGPIGWLVLIQGALGIASAAYSFSDLTSDVRGAP